MELHPDKTRLLEFGQFAEQDRKRRGEGKPDTFDFLGFTHISGKDRNGKFVVKHSRSIVSTPSEPTLPPRSDPFMAEVIEQLEKEVESQKRELEYARLKIEDSGAGRAASAAANCTLRSGQEKLSNLQLDLLEEAPAVSRDEVQAESEREPVAPPPPTSAPCRKGGGVHAGAMHMHRLRR